MKVVNLTKRYGKHTVLAGISFTIPQGAVVGFLGPNGAGKSTTLRILCGLIQASSGEAYVCGHCVAQEPQAVKKCIGYMPENNPLPGPMRAFEYLCFRAELKGLKHPKKAALHALDNCQIEPKMAQKRLDALSQGYRQRVGIADALLGTPPVIILDEPTNGLDPYQIQGLRTLLKTLQGKSTLILCTHSLAEAQRLCDYILILNHGTLIAQGPYDGQVPLEGFFTGEGEEGLRGACAP